MRRIMITGAAGLIGRMLRARWQGRWPMVLVDRVEMDPAGPDETVVRCDLTDALAMRQAMQGVDAVVHLGGVSTEAPWDAIRDANIEGCYQTFEAARIAGVRRMVFASSNHAIGFYPRATPLDGSEAVRPDTRYGVSKVFGEALARYYADKFGLSAVCLRIGTARQPDEPGERRHLATWISHRDLAQLIERAIEADIHFEIVFGASRNREGWWPDEAARRIGYQPEDSADDWRERVAEHANDLDPIARDLQGGIFCSWENTRVRASGADAVAVRQAGVGADRSSEETP